MLAAADARHSGIASGVNNAVARVAGLLAVAVLPAVAGLTGDNFYDPAKMTDGFHMAMVVCAVLAALGGVLAWFTISAEVLHAEAEPGGDTPERLGEDFSCGVGGAAAAARARGGLRARAGGGSRSGVSGEVADQRRDVAGEHQPPQPFEARGHPRFEPLEAVIDPFEAGLDLVFELVERGHRPCRSEHRPGLRTCRFDYRLERTPYRPDSSGRQAARQSTLLSPSP